VHISGAAARLRPTLARRRHRQRADITDCHRANCVSLL
jgi:hypothetical protein